MKRYWVLHLVFLICQHLETAKAFKANLLRYPAVCAGRSSWQLNAYATISEFNEALETAKSGSSAYEIFETYSGEKNVESLHAIVEHLASEGKFQEVEEVMYHMRSNYSISADDIVWGKLITTGSRVDWMTGKKYFTRMLKNGPIVSSIEPGSVLIKRMSKAGAWKDVLTLYNLLKEQPSWLSHIDAKFYENLLYYDARMGRWKDAVHWMDEMQARNILPNHKCFRFAVESCHKGNKPKLAVGYMDQMLEMLAGLGVDLQDLEGREEEVKEQKEEEEEEEETEESDSPERLEQGHDDRKQQQELIT